MPGMEKVFEATGFAEEVTPGTKVVPPTLYVPLVGIVKHNTTIARPEEPNGLRAATKRQKLTDVRGVIELSGNLDPRAFARFQRAFINGGSPTAGVLVPTTAGVYEYATVRAMTSLSEKSLTTVFGDPNEQLWSCANTIFETFTIAGDATAEDGLVTLEASGFTLFPVKEGAVVFPAMTSGSILAAAHAELYLDTATIGTTPYTTDLTTYEVQVPTGISPKKTAQGAGANLSWTRRGVAAASPTLTFGLEWNETVYDHYIAQNAMKARLLLHGVVIEGSFYERVGFDLYGPLEMVDLTENGPNRTHQYRITGGYEAAIASDLAVHTRIAVSSI